MKENTEVIWKLFQNDFISHVSTALVATCRCCRQYYVRDDGFRVMDGDLLGVSSETCWNLIGFDEDLTQRTFLRGRRLINGSMVFADLPRVLDVVDDFKHDASPTRFSVAVEIQTCKLRVI